MRKVLLEAGVVIAVRRSRTAIAQLRHSSDYPNLTFYFEENLCGNCHEEANEMNNSSTLTHHHVVDSEQSGSQPLECTTCHQPHIVDDSPWQPITDPWTKLLIQTADVPHDSGDNPVGAAQDNENFCLLCHDGSWSGAIDIASELADPFTINSGFYEGSQNKHYTHSDDPNPTSAVSCTYCHNAHGNTGTTGITRRALLYDWIQVNRYPYWRWRSCFTDDPLGVCH